MASLDASVLKTKRKSDEKMNLSCRKQQDIFIKKSAQSGFLREKMA